MENQFFIDAESLSESALAKKHQLENDPSSRKDHMEYLPGMEVIESDVRDKVMSQVNAFDYSGYTAKDVKTALEHETCTIEDFKALLSPAAEPFQIPIEARIGDGYAVRIENLCLAGSGESRDGEGHGDAVILSAVDDIPVER